MDWKTKEWVLSHKDKLQGKVLDVGSYNVNGGLCEVIDVTVGLDMRKGRGVDLVASVSDLKDHFADGYFDACVSAGTVEHVEDWKAFFQNTWDVVKDGGYLVMTIAAPWKGRHNYPNDYWRLSIDQIKTIYPNAEWVGKVGGVSYGWVVKKEGSINLDVNPSRVQ
jgi:SAM-dependent methyltransferase